jgi:DNA polymerase-3 subunit delta
MTGLPAKALSDLRAGRPAAIYLLHGDELLAREEAQVIVDALVPKEHRSLSVEVVGDEDAASVPTRLGTVPLFGGMKIVVVHDTRALVSKQNAGDLFRRSRDAWREDRREPALRYFRQAAEAAGLERAVLERAATAGLVEKAWSDMVGIDAADDTEDWFRELAGRIVADGGGTSPSGGGAASVYDDLLNRGIPAGAVLILTAEVVDQRRALFKRIKELGVVVDCGVRAGRSGETQMKPEVARARIVAAAGRAGKRVGDDALQAIVERTGFSVRTLDSELEKILLYLGTRTEVQRSDVLAVLSSSREASIFDLTNALETGDAAAALRALRALAVQREAALPILGMTASAVRNLILARCVLDRHFGGRFDPRTQYGAFQARVLSSLSADATGDDRAAAKIREMNPFRAFNLLRAAGRFTQADLLERLQAIHDADLALKTTGQPEALILETLILTLCGPHETKT